MGRTGRFALLCKKEKLDDILKYTIFILFSAGGADPVFCTDPEKRCREDGNLCGESGAAGGQPVLLRVG